MRVTSEDVKAVQHRIDVTYEEAEKYLIKADGDIDLAVYMINRKRESSSQRFMEEAKRIFNELLTYYIKVEKKDKIYLNMPLIFIVMFFVLVDLDTKIWVMVVSIGMILISESQVSIFKEKKKGVEEAMLIRREEEKRKKETPVDEAPVSVEETEVMEAAGTDNVDSGQTASEKSDDDNDDDYYEITIEK